jgi:hypothetical protein
MNPAWSIRPLQMGGEVIVLACFPDLKIGIGAIADVLKDHGLSAITKYNPSPLIDSPRFHCTPRLIGRLSFVAERFNSTC